MRFFNNHAANGRELLRQTALGRLEAGVMEIVWARGESSVRDVVRKIGRPLAYTTVMTTLDRLFKKGLLARHKSDRAFLYAPRVSREEWERRRANDFVEGFLAGRQTSREALLSCLMDAVGHYDEELLEDLEKRIRLKRKELFRRGQP